MDNRTPAPPDQLAERQREAISTLSVLSNQCAEADRTARTRHEARLAEIEDRHREITRFIEARAQRDLEQACATLDDEIARLGTLSDTDRQRLATEAEDQLEQIAGDLDARLTRLREELDHTIWTAESVLEGIDAKLARKQRARLEAADAHSTRIDQLADQARARLKRLGLPAEPIDPPLETPEPDPEPPTTDPTAAIESASTRAEQALARLDTLTLPSMVAGIKPYGVGLLLCALAGGIGYLLGSDTTTSIGIAGAAALGTFIAFFIILRILVSRGRHQIRTAIIPLNAALTDARRQIAAIAPYAQSRRDTLHAAAAADRDKAVAKARARFEPLIADMTASNQATLEEARTRAQAALASRGAKASARYDQLVARRAHLAATIENRRDRRLQQADTRLAEQRAANDRQRDQATADIDRRWETGRTRIEADIRQLTDMDAHRFPPWDDSTWDHWQPPHDFSDVLRFGRLKIDTAAIMTDLARSGRFKLGLPEAFAVPALLTAPDHRSMLIQAGDAGRDQAIHALQAVMSRVLTAMPPGRVKFTLIDPVGLGQSFAGFMHLADHDESLVTSRIWSEPSHIQARLADLTEHMENVIQKYLRNDYETIDAYNQQAGELAEPYRFLVVSDFPTGFNPEAISRLAGIASSGARCGVFVLVYHDTRQPLPGGTHIEDLQSKCVTVAHQDNRWIWQDELYRRFELNLDNPPPEKLLTRIINTVGVAARDASRVEVPFQVIAPTDDARWTRSARDELAVPVGRSGATRLQSVTLGRGVAQHALVAGKTGSGKSTLLHVMITNLALWHHPDEVEFYLIDFKKGVEFKSYADLGLPHARAIAIESDREFGLSVLQRLDAEMERRGELFRKHGVQNIAAYRRLPDSRPLPRTLLLIDEFHEFFVDDDKIAQDASLLLDRLVRQGRAFGVHAFLGSQSLGGAQGLGRGTMGQMAVRIAMQCSEADAQLILNDDNTAARLLTRPGEAIYNDQSGAIEGNSPFQISWLPDDQRDQLVRQIATMARDRGVENEPTIVFEGNAAADPEKNRALTAALSSDRPSEPPPALHLWIGEPVAIKDPTALTLRRQAAANALIIGQQEEAAAAMLSSAMIAIAAQSPVDRARLYLFDGSTADSPMHGRLAQISRSLPHQTLNVTWRDTDQVISDLADEVKRRIESDTDPATEPALFIIIYGLQRYRSLRKTEDDFSFSMDDDSPAAPKPDKQFSEIIREGAAVGVHVITWCDTPISLDRTIDRGMMREFDYRVLFQMSATDSSNLIDSPAANTLGLYRALCYSEEQGTFEKFRPYALPPAAFLEQIQEKLGHHPPQPPPTPADRRQGEDRRRAPRVEQE